MRPVTVLSLLSGVINVTAATILQSSKYYVNGSSIPRVDFDVGESYAGLLPLSRDLQDDRQLFFWYFVSENRFSSDEIVIWLNGGPGASSLAGLLQENGPFLWQFGTFKPVKNPWTWINLTSVVWVEQPIGTGFTQGTATAKTEQDVSSQFMGWWQNFVDEFHLHGRKVYICGESYAGMYVPYLADAMLNANDTIYFNLKGTMMYDPVINNNAVMRQVPSASFLRHWNNLLNLNQSFVNDIETRAHECGYNAFLEEHLRYPPKGPLPPPPPDGGTGDFVSKECNIWGDIFAAASLINPCFSIYEITTTCPLLWDALGFPGTVQYVPEGAMVYFDEPEVKAAINAPQVSWAEASPHKVYNTSSGVSLNWSRNEFTGLTVLPGVIERSERTVIGHGGLDYILLTNGTLLTIQNMTWNGHQGFQGPITDDFIIPYRPEFQMSTLAGGGVMGQTRTERGLTFFTVNLSGHMIPQFAPSASYRSLEYLLGRIPSLTYL